MHYSFIFLRRLLPALLLLLTSLPMAAQPDSIPGENWDSYLAKFEKGTGSVLLNMSLKKMAPFSSFPFLLATGVRARNCDEQGFPSSKEYISLAKLSDSVKSRVEKTTSAILCGTFTYQCQRLDYYYIHDTAWIRAKLVRFYTEYFPGYEFFIQLKAEPGWSTYKDFLYPDEKMQDYMANQKLLMALQRAGDKLNRARPIDHTAYFPDERSVNNFLSFLVKNKFKVTARDNKGIPGFPLRLQFTRTDLPAIASLSRLTMELRSQAARCNGTYDGWETILLK